MAPSSPWEEVLARSRAGAYALAACTAAPQAVQVADHFHLVRNVSDALKELVRSHRWNRPSLAGQAATSPQAEQTSAPIAFLERPSGERQPTPTKQACWEAVQQ